MTSGLSDRVVAWVADNPATTLEQIARGVRARTSSVRDVLQSTLFQSASRDQHPSDQALVYSLRSVPVDGLGRPRKLTHDEKVLRLLSDGRAHTHHELYALHVVAHSRVASLRAKGHQIDAWRDGDDYMYRLVGTPSEAAVSPAAAASPGAPRLRGAGGLSTHGTGAPDSSPNAATESPLAVAGSQVQLDLLGTAA